ncbi:MAG TPA: GNAT family N-acetyltransferase [Terriglobales bacterium]|nr:GNAT family N-acetyltransferase [Terriglobales bacterium]
MSTVEFRQGNALVSTDRGRLDINLIYEFLSKRSYWAEGVPRDVVEHAIENSLCFGLFEGGRQVGFARAITDYATFAYLADVFVLESHRGRGLSKFLMECIVKHPKLQNLRRWMLATKDAHSLYAKFGFAPLEQPERFMCRANPDVYKRG